VSLVSVPDDQLAAVVTYLEMRSAPPTSVQVPSPLSLWTLERPDLAEYRRLFRLVGSRWLWFSRLVMDDAELEAIIHHPKVAFFPVVDDRAGEVGLLELDFRIEGECEIAFIGLIPELAGQGHGRWLLTEALHLAWRDGIVRVHVHTCTLDHPAALAAYRRAGFEAISRAVETFPDPRLTGLLPRDCAPQIPLIGSSPAT
jgi:GNAT superfamily N-acetyltransferase